jgi:hypothetical protein
LGSRPDAITAKYEQFAVFASFSNTGVLRKRLQFRVDASYHIVGIAISPGQPEFWLNQPAAMLGIVRNGGNH